MTGPRIVLLTGKGGVGKTTLAAGTATLSAREGRRTLVMSTDAAHSLTDAYGRTGPPPGDEPFEVEPGLWVHQVDAQRRLERSWGDVSGYLHSVLDVAGVDRLTAEELTVVPGIEEVLALLALREHALEDWDTIVVDCAPTAETLRLLALPEAVRWYLDRIAGPERRLVRALRPVVARATGMPMPDDAVLDAVELLHTQLLDVHRLLSRPESTVRLVLTPERVVLAEARRSLTTLSLYGYRVDGVVANRVFPGGDLGSWVEGWVTAQRDVLAEVEESFAPLPVWSAAYAAHEPVGADAVADLARAAYAGSDAFAVPRGDGPVGVHAREGGAELRIALPFVTGGDVDLGRHGDELVVSVGSYRRLLTLPASLAAMDVSGAGVDGGALRVRFRRTDDASRDAGGEGAP